MDMWGAGVGWCSEGGVSVREGGNTPWQRWAGDCELATSAGMYYLSLITVRTAATLTAQAAVAGAGLEAGLVTRLHPGETHAAIR